MIRALFFNSLSPDFFLAWTFALDYLELLLHHIIIVINYSTHISTHFRIYRSKTGCDADSIDLCYCKFDSLAIILVLIWGHSVFFYTWEYCTIQSSPIFLRRLLG